MSKEGEYKVDGLKLPPVEISQSTARTENPSSARTENPSSAQEHLPLMPPIKGRAASVASSVTYSDSDPGSPRSDASSVASAFTDAPKKGFHVPPLQSVSAEKPQVQAPSQNQDMAAVEEGLLRQRPRETLPPVAPSRGTIADRLAAAKASPEGEQLAASFATGRKEALTPSARGDLMPKASGTSLASTLAPVVRGLRDGDQRRSRADVAEKTGLDRVDAQVAEAAKIRTEDQAGREAAGRARYGENLAAIASNSKDRRDAHSAGLAEQSAGEMFRAKVEGAEWNKDQEAINRSAQIAGAPAAEVRARLGPDYAKGAETDPEMAARAAATAATAEKGRVMVDSSAGAGYLNREAGHKVGGQDAELLTPAPRRLPPLRVAEMKLRYPPVSASGSLSPSSGVRATGPSKPKGAGIS